MRDYIVDCCDYTEVWANSYQTYFTSDGGVLGFGEVGMDDVLLASEVEG